MPEHGCCSRSSPKSRRKECKAKCMRLCNLQRVDRFHRVIYQSRLENDRMDPCDPIDPRLTPSCLLCFLPLRLFVTLRLSKRVRPARFRHFAGFRFLSSPCITTTGSHHHHHHHPPRVVHATQPCGWLDEVVLVGRRGEVRTDVEWTAVPSRPCDDSLRRESAHRPGPKA